MRGDARPERGSDPTERRETRSRSRVRSRPRRERDRRRSVSGSLNGRYAPSPTVVPGATLAGLGAVAALAGARAALAATGLLREWSLAVGVLFGVAGCLLGAVALAHVAASVAARRIGTGK